MKTYFTSESVTEGHPDKICDIIADTILDEALKADKNSHMAVECTIKDELIFIYGEASTKAVIDYEKVAKNVLKDIGYHERYKVITKISKQSKEINNAVVGKELGAGNQGIMFGYATNETKEFMPMPILFASNLSKKLTQVRKNNKDSFLRPDGKTQVTIEYEDGKPKRVDTIVVSTQHKKGISKEILEDYIIQNVILDVIPREYLDDETKVYINPSGSFIKGGSFTDSGTTGRKIICDTYGGMGKVGGGCFSSKDPSKVDRSAAYYARYVAKNIVAHNLADKCEIQISYAIGKSKPLSIYIDTFNTNKCSIKKIYKFVEDNFDFSVFNIIKELDLLNTKYAPFACYGHFGRLDLMPNWEKIKEI